MLDHCALQADVFAFGVTAWEILTGAQELPHDDLSDSVDIGRAVLKSGLRPDLPRSWRRDWRRQLSVLMQDCWAEDSRMRPSMNEVVMRLDKIVSALPAKGKK